MAELSIRVGVGALIVKDGKILLGTRNVDDNKGKWELFGGLVRSSETLDGAIKRLVREEAGIGVEPDVIIAHYDRHFDDTNTLNVGLCFRCKHISGEPHQTEFGRVADFKWVEMDGAFKMDLTPYTKIQIEQYKGWLKVGVD